MKRLARKLAGSKASLAESTKTSSVASMDMTAEEAAEVQQVWGLSQEEEWQLTSQLRDEIEMEAGQLAPEFDDFALRRFLRARKHNILKAKTMFLDQLKWRKENAVDTVLTDFDFHEREDFGRYYPEAFYGVDRLGRPIYVQQPGKIDTEQLWKFTTLDRCVRYHLQQQERYWRIVAPCASLASGHRHEQSLVIIDMEGVGISTLTGEVRKIMAIIMQIDQDYYPELMWKCVIINAPTTFRVIWSMVKYLMDARTQAKIEAGNERLLNDVGLPSQVLGSNYQEELLRLVAPENLMQRYGGTNPAPLCSEPGPWKDEAVLERLYAQRRQRLAAEGRQEGMTWPPLRDAAAGHEVQPPSPADAAAAAAGEGARAIPAEGEVLAVAAS